MGSPKATREYVKMELPYRLLMKIYENSRYSLKQLAKENGLTYHTVAKSLADLESRYQLFYTLELNESALGFSEGRLITIKFREMPNIEVIKSLFINDLNIQDAYLATGDFDIVIYTVGLSPRDFQHWQFNLRVRLSRYRPILKFSNINAYSIGFFPLKSEVIKESTVLSELEKKVLVALNNNSRIKLKDLIKSCRTTQMKAIYTLRKLQEKGIIKKFTALTQNPEKKVFLAYGISITASEKHKDLAIAFAKELLHEDMHEITNDFDLDASSNGAYDEFFICTLDNGELAHTRGHGLHQKLWIEEFPRIRKAVLTSVIVGKWPFHLENYRNYAEMVKRKDYSV